MSYAVGVVKPDPGIFQRSLEVLDLPASEVLMVGDAWRDDAGAAALGVRTLILPRTDDPSHGLELVLRLVTSAAADVRMGPCSTSPSRNSRAAAPVGAQAR